MKSKKLFTKKYNPKTKKFEKVVVEPTILKELSCKTKESKELKTRKVLTSKYQQRVFVEDYNIKIINSMNDYIYRFDWNFFKIYDQDTKVLKFKEKLLKIKSKLKAIEIARESKNNEYISIAITNFKLELKDYKSLKKDIELMLENYKYNKKCERQNFNKRYKANKKPRTNNFGMHNYGSVLSVTSGRKHSY